MATLITDTRLEERLKEERRARGVDRHDEVWEGVYFMAPLPNNEHQEIVGRLVSIFEFVVGWPGLAKVFPGVNLAGLSENWEHDYRAPDIAVFRRDTQSRSCDTHWRGGADFVVEVTSPGDRSREKIPFYDSIGVRELLIIDRKPWTLELYRHQAGRLEIGGRSSPNDGEILVSQLLPLRFRLLAGEPRPGIEVVYVANDQTWTV
jgi:Uma2 family endonuclease